MPPGLTRRVFEASTSRHFIPIFDALQDDAVRQVVIAKPVRGGGTLISDIWHCWTRANDPGPAMAILQTDDIAKDHFQDRLRMMMLKSPVLQSLLPEDRHGVTKSEIRFRDGLPMFVTGPSISNLQTKGLRYVSCDEVWLYKPGTVVEAEGRLGDFTKMGLSKLLLISQGGVEDDDFDRRFKDGSCEEWEVACVGCGSYFQPRFKWGEQEPYRGLRWDEHKDDKGFWNIEACLASIRYECPHCGHAHKDGASTKQAWNRSGRYAVTNGNAPKSKRSFHWPGTIDWPWDKLVEFYLSARNALRMGMVEPTIQFWQKYMAEPKSEKSALDGGAEIKRVDAHDNSNEFIRCLCCDRQAEGLYWAAVYSISKLGNISVLWFGKLYGGAALKAKADEFRCHNVLIDSGFEAKGPHGVYALCCEHGSPAQHWIATKGEDTTFFWHQVAKGKRVMRSYSERTKGDPEAGSQEGGKRFATLIRFSSDVMNERLDAMISRSQFSVAAEQPTADHEEFKRQIGSEYRKRKEDKFTGRMRWVWVCPSRNNHLRDCSKQAVLAAIMGGVLVDQADSAHTEPHNDLPAT
jgi:hypothetical protein